MESGSPGAADSAVLDALARIDELRGQGLGPDRIADVMAAEAAPVPAGGDWSVDKVDRILEVFDAVRQSDASPSPEPPAPSLAPTPVRSPLSSPAPSAPPAADAPAEERSSPRSPVRMALVGILLAGSGAGGFLAVDALAERSRSDDRLGVEATAATTTTAAPVPTTAAPNPADTMAIRIETDQTDRSGSAPGSSRSGELAPATATIRNDGRLYIEGTFATAESASAFVDQAGSVFGRENIVESYVIDDDAPAPAVADVGLDKPVLFESGTAVIDPDYIEFLEACAGVLALNPHIVLSVTAYTDSLGDEDFNLALSQQRAQAIVDFYRDREIGDDQLLAFGAGEADPVAPNETDDGRSANRRAMLELLNVVGDEAVDAGS